MRIFRKEISRFDEKFRGILDSKTNMVHIQRDEDHISGTTREGELKTKASNRFVPVPAPLREKPVEVRELPERYVFHGRNGELLSASTFSRKWQPAGRR